MMGIRYLKRLHINNSNSFNYKTALYSIELKQMKMEVQSAIYKRPDMVRYDNESVNTTMRLTSKHKSTSQGFNSTVIQKKFPQIPLDNVSEI